MEYSVKVQTILKIYRCKETPECKDKCDPINHPECVEEVYTTSKPLQS